MEEIFNNIYILNERQYNSLTEYQKNSDMFFIFCAKYPFWNNEFNHSINQKDEIDILMRDNNKVYLNLVDARDITGINTTAVDRGLKVAIGAYNKNWKVAFVCNKGISRSPTFAMILNAYINKSKLRFIYLVAQMKTIYPKYSPNKGILDYAEKIYNKL